MLKGAAVVLAVLCVAGCVNNQKQFEESQRRASEAARERRQEESEHAGEITNSIFHAATQPADPNAPKPGSFPKVRIGDDYAELRRLLKADYPWVAVEHKLETADMQVVTFGVDRFGYIYYVTVRVEDGAITAISR